MSMSFLEAVRHSQPHNFRDFDEMRFSECTIEWIKLIWCVSQLPATAHLPQHT